MKNLVLTLAAIVGTILCSYAQEIEWLIEEKGAVAELGDYDWYDIHGLQEKGEFIYFLIDGTDNLPETDERRFLTCYSKSGVKQWMNEIGGNSGGTTLITIDDHGYIYLIQYNNESPYDQQLFKFSPNGEMLWTKSLSNELYAATLAIDADGNCIIGGVIYSNSNIQVLDYTVSTPLGGHAFIMKASPEGHVIWFRYSVETSSDGVVMYPGGAMVKSVDINEDNEIFFTGTFEIEKGYEFSFGDASVFSADYNEFLSAKKDVLIGKMDKDGEVLWLKAFAGADDDWGTTIKADKEGGAFFTGLYNDSIKVTDSYQHNSFVDYVPHQFVGRISGDNQIIWFKTLNGNAVSEHGLCLLSDGIVVGGDFAFSARFDNIKVTGEGSSDHAYLAKYDFDGSIQWVVSEHGYGASFRNLVAAEDDQVFFSGIYTPARTTEPRTKFGNYELPATNPPGNILYRRLMFGKFNPNKQEDEEEEEVVVAIQNNGASYLAIYPNPTRDRFSLSTQESATAAKLTILDPMGRVVRSIPISSENLTYDVSDLPNGFYFVEVEMRDKTRTRTRLIKG